MKNKKTKRLTALVLTFVMLLQAIPMTALLAFAGEGDGAQEESVEKVYTDADYNALYVTDGLTFAWDGFDIDESFDGTAVSWYGEPRAVVLGGNYVWTTEEDVRKAAVEGGYFLSHGVADFTSLLPKHTDDESGLTVLEDMTFEMVLSNQWNTTGGNNHENYTGVFQVAPGGASFIGSWTQKVGDLEKYGPITTTCFGYYSNPDTTKTGRYTLFYDMSDWGNSKSTDNRLLGAPMGEVYSLAISHDFTMNSATTGDLLVRAYHNTAPAIDSSWGGSKTEILTVYDARYVGNMNSTSDYGEWKGFRQDANENTLKLQFGGGKNGVMRFGYHAIRMYDRALSTDELEQNHLADILKYYKLDITEYLTKTDAKKKLIADAFKDVKIGECDRDAMKEKLAAALEPTLDEIYSPYYARPESLLFRFDATEMTLSGGELLEIPNLIDGGMAITNRASGREKHTIGGGGYGVSLKAYPQDGSILFTAASTLMLTPFIQYKDVNGTQVATDMTVEINMQYPSSYQTSPTGKVINTTTNFNGSVNYMGPLSFQTFAKVNANQKDENGNWVDTGLLEDTATNPITKWFDRFAGRLDNGTSPFLGHNPDRSFYTAIRFDYQDTVTDVSRIPYDFTIMRDGKISLLFENEPYSALEDYSPLDENDEIKLQLTFGATVATQYRSIRIYNCALTDLEIMQNHAVDLMKYYRVDTDLLDALDYKAAERFYEAVSTYQLDETSKEAIEAILINFALTGGALGVITPEDFLSFDGVQTRTDGYAGMRVRYSVDAARLAVLAELKAEVTYGVIYGKTADFESAEALTLSYSEGIGEFVADAKAAKNAAINRNGEWNLGEGYYLKETDEAVSFGVPISICDVDGENFDETVDTEYYVRAYIAACIDGSPLVLYLDLDSEAFGKTLSARRVSDYFLCNGYADAPIPMAMADEQLLAVAQATQSLYAEGEITRLELVRLLSIVEGVSVGAKEHLAAYHKVGETSSVNLSITKALEHGIKLATSRGYLSTFVKLGNASYTEAGVLYEALLPIIEARKTAAYAAIADMGLSEEEADALVSEVTSALERGAQKAETKLTELAGVPDELAKVQANLNDSSYEAKISKAINATSAFSLEGTNIGRYTIVTDSANAAIGTELQRFFLANHAAFVGHYVTDNEYIGDVYGGEGLIAIYIGMTNKAGTEKDHYSVYFEDGALYIEGADAKMLSGGVSAFVRTFAIGKGRIGVTADQLNQSNMKNVAYTGLLSDFNLPDTFTEKKVTSYDAAGVLKLFYERCAEKPEEITVLPIYKPEDFPLSTKIVYHVAVNGSDETGDGTMEKPFATLQYAADKLAYRSGGVIYIHGGTYRLDTTLTLDDRHSGSAMSPTIITAYGDGEVVFTTSRSIAGSAFTAVKDAAFVSDADKARIDKFTAGNSSKVYAVNLLDHGITLSDLAIYKDSASQPSVSIGDSSYVIARYPNFGETNEEIGATDGYVLTLKTWDVRKVGNVQSGVSSLYANHKDETGTWEIYYDNTDYKDRLLGYSVASGDVLYMYGSLYEEWDLKTFSFTLHTDATTERPYMKGTDASYYGVKHTGDNKLYFFGMLEDLDTAGEYIVDAESGILYVYAPSDFASQTLQIALKTSGPIVVDGTKNAVISGMTVEHCNGIGITLQNTENVLVQDMYFNALGGNGVRISNTIRSGVTHSEFTACTGVSFGYANGGNVIPSQEIIQNNVFRNATAMSQNAVSGSTHGYVISHNYFYETTITIGGLEGIVEYNEFDRGNQFIIDNGPIYTTNASRALHIRYNSLHDLNYSQYGIYLDDMTSGSYVYGNVVHYGEDAGSHGKAVNLHNGNMNVVMNNICISTTGSAIVNNLNYYPTRIDGMVTSGGGLAYRWGSMLKEQLQARFDVYDHAQMEKYYPFWYWYHLKVDEAAELMAKDPTWSNDEKYTPKDDVDIFVRTPGMCVYMNNVAVDCTKLLSIPGVSNNLCIISGNVEYKTVEEVGFVDAANGNYALKSDSIIYKNNPDFKPINYDRIGVVEH